MTEIERLRNEFVDAGARTVACQSNEDWEEASIAQYDAARALAKALDAPQREKIRTGWFTATCPLGRVRGERRADGAVYAEDGRRHCPAGDFSITYTDIQWEDDAKQDPTNEPFVRQYTEEQINAAWDRCLLKYQTVSYRHLFDELRKNR